MKKLSKRKYLSSRFPSITIAIPSFNEERMIGTCLDSIVSQDYPKNKLKIIVVDDNSTDRTVQIAKKYPVKILYNGSHDAERSKLIAYRSCNSEFYCYLDADITLMGNDWLKNMIAPFLDNKELTGVFTKFVGRITDTTLQRYYNLNPLQLDPIFQFFSPSIKSKIARLYDNYAVCRFNLFSIPPIGICVYKTSLLKSYLSREDRYMELDLMARMVEDGYNLFAYVDKPGIYHDSFRTMSDIISKRLRNISSVYLSNLPKRKYTWFNLKNRKDIVKIIVWTLYANSLIFPFFVGLYKSIRYNTLSGLWEVIVAPIVTDIIIIGFLIDKRGRLMIQRGFS